jgi:hypothetical protein
MCPGSTQICNSKEGNVIMTKQGRANRDRFISMLMSTATHHGKEIEYTQARNIADWLHRCETTLSRLAEDECNYPKYDEAKQERTEKRVEETIAETIGCKCYTQRDPRGYCIRLYLVNDQGMPWFNTWDGETSGCNW